MSIANLLWEQERNRYILTYAQHTSALQVVSLREEERALIAQALIYPESTVLQKGGWSNQELRLNVGEIAIAPISVPKGEYLAELHDLGIIVLPDRLESELERFFNEADNLIMKAVKNPIYPTRWVVENTFSNEILQSTAGGTLLQIIAGYQEK